MKLSVQVVVQVHQIVHRTERFGIKVKELPQIERELVYQGLSGVGRLLIEVDGVDCFQGLLAFFEGLGVQHGLWAFGLGFEVVVELLTGTVRHHFFEPPRCCFMNPNCILIFKILFYKLSFVSLLLLQKSSLFFDTNAIFTHRHIGNHGQFLYLFRLCGYGIEFIQGILYFAKRIGYLLFLALDMLQNGILYVMFRMIYRLRIID